MEAKASLLEKILINWALPPKMVFHTLLSYATHNEYYHQSLSERWCALRDHAINDYELLLKIKARKGYIPKRVEKIFKKTLCDYTKYALANNRPSYLIT